MKLSLSLIMIYGQTLIAADFEIWRLEKKHYLLAQEPQNQYLISKHCLEKKNSCKAFEVLQENKKYTLKKNVLKGEKALGPSFVVKF